MKFLDIFKKRKRAAPLQTGVRVKILHDNGFGKKGEIITISFSTAKFGVQNHALEFTDEAQTYTPSPLL